MSSAPSHPRAAVTRERLVKAGHDLLADRPIDAISVNEIVAVAGVAKGSFFNHFEDKTAFARQLAADIRADLEARVGAANGGLADPLLRLAGGMGVAVGFALAEPQRCSVMVRAMDWSIGGDHPLNAGVVADLKACREAGLIVDDNSAASMAYWLGLCQVAIISALQAPRDVQEVSGRLRTLVLMALRGLGCEPVRAGKVADATAARLTADLEVVRRLA